MADDLSSGIILTLITDQERWCDMPVRYCGILLCCVHFAVMQHSACAGYQYLWPCRAVLLTTSASQSLSLLSAVVRVARLCCQRLCCPEHRPAGSPCPGSAPSGNGVLPNMPSPTMSTFSVGAPPSSQPQVVSEAGVFTNGLPQSYPAREYRWSGLT